MFMLNDLQEYNAIYTQTSDDFSRRSGEARRRKKMKLTGALPLRESGAYFSTESLSETSFSNNTWFNCGVLQSRLATIIEIVLQLL